MNGAYFKSVLVLKEIPLRKFAKIAGWDQSRLSKHIKGTRQVKLHDMKIIMKTCKKLRVSVNPNELFPELAEIFAE